MAFYSNISINQPASESLQNLWGDSEMSGDARGLVIGVNYKIVYWFNPFLTGLKKKNEEATSVSTAHFISSSIWPGGPKVQNYSVTNSCSWVGSSAFMSFFSFILPEQEKMNFIIVCSWNINPNFALIFILTIISLVLQNSEWMHPILLKATDLYPVNLWVNRGFCYWCVLIHTKWLY